MFTFLYLFSLLFNIDLDNLTWHVILWFLCGSILQQLYIVPMFYILCCYFCLALSCLCVSDILYGRFPLSAQYIQMDVSSRALYHVGIWFISYSAIVWKPSMIPFPTLCISATIFVLPIIRCSSTIFNEESFSFWNSI